MPTQAPHLKGEIQSQNFLIRKRICHPRLNNLSIQENGFQPADPNKVLSESTDLSLDKISPLLPIKQINSDNPLFNSAQDSKQSFSKNGLQLKPISKNVIIESKSSYYKSPMISTKCNIPFVKSMVGKKKMSLHITDDRMELIDGSEEKPKIHPNSTKNIESSSASYFRVERGLRKINSQKNSDCEDVSGKVSGPGKHKNSYEEKSSTKKTENLNFPSGDDPLIPFKKFFFENQKNERELKFSNRRIRTLLEKADMIKYTYDELITLDSGSYIKKMLHVPTLKLFSAIEIEDTTGGQIAIKIAKAWKSESKKRAHILKVIETFPGFPEGKLSVLYEFMNGGTLETLLENYGSLNEKVLKKIAKDIALGLSDLGSSIQETYFTFGALRPDTIHLSRDGTSKIFLKLKNSGAESNSRFSYENNSLPHHHNYPDLTSNSETMKSFEKLKRYSIYAQDISRSNNLSSFERRILPEFGSLLLLCAVGDIWKMENDEKNLPLKAVNRNCFFIEKKETKQKYCCMAHKIIELGLAGCENPRKNGLTEEKFNFKLVAEILQTRFSLEFIDFLCNCLRLDNANQEGFNLKSLLDHPWIKHQNTFQGPDVSLPELVLLERKSFNTTFLRDKSQDEDNIEKIFNKIEFVLPDEQQKEKRSQLRKIFSTLKPSDEFISDLAWEKGWEPEKLIKRLKKSLISLFD